MKINKFSIFFKSFFGMIICLLGIMIVDSSALVIEYPTNLPGGRVLRLVITKEPGGLALDRHGNIYYSDQGDDLFDNGKIIMIPKETNMPITILSGLDTPGDIELSADGRALIVSEDGDKIRLYYFGLSVQFQDQAGNLIYGLTVYADIPGVGISKGYKQMVDDYYHIPEILVPQFTSETIDIVVEFQSGRTVRFPVEMGQDGESGVFGQTIKNFMITQ